MRCVYTKRFETDYYAVWVFKIAIEFLLDFSALEFTGWVFISWNAWKFVEIKCRIQDIDTLDIIELPCHLVMNSHYLHVYFIVILVQNQMVKNLFFFFISN